MTRTHRLFARLPLAFLAGGCAILGGSPPERYGGSATLSGAAHEAASDSSDKHKRLDVGDTVPTYTEWTESEGGEEFAGDAGASNPSHAAGGGDHMVLGAVGG